MDATAACQGQQGLNLLRKIALFTREYENKVTLQSLFSSGEI